MFKAMLFKEILLIIRDKHALIALFVMPAVFILIMSLALKDVFNDDRALIEYALIDKDKSSQSALISSHLRTNKFINEHNISIENTKSFEDEKIQFLVTIPEGYKSQFESRSSEKKALIVEVASNVSQSHLIIFKMQILNALMQMRINIIENTQKKLTRDSKMIRPSPKIDLNESEILKIQYTTLQEGEKPTSTQQSVPSWIIFGLFFVIIPMSTIFINERKQNTLTRLTSMNVSLPVLFSGKMLPYILINQLQVWVMIAVGMYIVPLFGAAPLNIGGSLVGLIAISLALSLSAICLSILIAVLVDSVEQATTIGGLVNILLGAIGGIMVPKFVMPEFMQDFSNISPMSWGLEGFLDIFLRHGTLYDVMNEVIALSCFAILSLLCAVIIYQYKIRTST